MYKIILLVVSVSVILIVACKFVQSHERKEMQAKFYYDMFKIQVMAQNGDAEANQFMNALEKLYEKHEDNKIITEWYWASYERWKNDKNKSR